MKSSTIPAPSIPLSTNKHLLRWVEKMAELTRPAAIHWVDGSQEEYESLCSEMVSNGTFIKLNQKLWPGLLPGQVRRKRCSARRRSHFYLLAFQR